MMIETTSLDFLFAREYDEDNYNCLHLVCEAWKALSGDDIEPYFNGMLATLENRKVDAKKRHYFELIKRPKTPCIVQMRNKGQVPHVGLFIDGMVMQITQQGVQNQPLEISTRGFKLVKYYRKKL